MPQQLETELDQKSLVFDGAAWDRSFMMRNSSLIADMICSIDTFFIDSEKANDNVLLLSVISKEALSELSSVAA